MNKTVRHIMMSGLLLSFSELKQIEIQSSIHTHFLHQKYSIAFIFGGK